MPDFEQIMQFIESRGLAIVLVVIFTPLVVDLIRSMKKTNESNATAIQELKSASTQSGSNHGITHVELHSTKATLRHSIDAAIAYVDSQDDEKVSQKVKPHLEKAKAEAEK